MWFKIFKALTQPSTLIFLALITLLIAFGFQFAVGVGALSITILSAAAPILLGIFLGLMFAAVVGGVVWSLRYFYHDYQSRKKMDEEFRTLLKHSIDSNLNQPTMLDDEPELGFQLEEEVGIAEHPPSVNEGGSQHILEIINTCYGLSHIKSLSDITEEERNTILGSNFSYRNAFFQSIKKWCTQNKKAIIITGILLAALMITLIVFSSLFLAGVPLPLFVGIIFNGLVGFFEAGFVGLGWAASAAFAMHHFVAMLLAGLVFCIAPINIITMLERFGSLLYRPALSIAQAIKKLIYNPNPVSEHEDTSMNNELELSKTSPNTPLDKGVDSGRVFVTDTKTNSPNNGNDGDVDTKKIFDSSI